MHRTAAEAVRLPVARRSSGLAGCLDAPILITAPGDLPATIEAEIERLGATDVVIVGGTAAVSVAVEDRLSDEMGLSVERIGGRDRYEVSRRIAEEVRAHGMHEGRVFIASSISSTP